MKCADSDTPNTIKPILNHYLGNSFHFLRPTNNQIKIHEISFGFTSLKERVVFGCWCQVKGETVQRRKTTWLGYRWFYPPGGVWKTPVEIYFWLKALRDSWFVFLCVMLGSLFDVVVFTSPLTFLNCKNHEKHGVDERFQNDCRSHFHVWTESTSNVQYFWNRGDSPSKNVAFKTQQGNNPRLKPHWESGNIWFTCNI